MMNIRNESIADAVRDVADFVENRMGLGLFDIMPGIHERADRERADVTQAGHKLIADALRAFALRTETQPVKLSEFILLIKDLPIPDKIRKPAEWAIYDRYGA